TRSCWGAGYRSWKGWTCAPSRRATTSSSCCRSRSAVTKERRRGPSCGNEGINVAFLRAFSIAALIYCCSGISAATPEFRVVAFYTGKEDPAHISFLREAERWFPAMAAKYHFSYDATSDWHNLNADFL